MCTRAHATLHTWLWTEAIHPSSISSEATFGEAEGALNCKYNVNGKGSGNGLALKFPQSWTAFQFHAPRLARRAPTRSAARLDGTSAVFRARSRRKLPGTWVSNGSAQLLAPLLGSLRGGTISGKWRRHVNGQTGGEQSIVRSLAFMHQNRTAVLHGL